MREDVFNPQPASVCSTVAKLPHLLFEELIRDQALAIRLKELLNLEILGCHPKFSSVSRVVSPAIANLTHTTDLVEAAIGKLDVPGQTYWGRKRLGETVSTSTPRSARSSGTVPETARL